MFDGGVLDCKMIGGVFRSGELRENADLESDVKMANKSTFWKISPIDKKIDGLEK